jgi:hypothetical protein
MVITSPGTAEAAENLRRLESLAYATPSRSDDNQAFRLTQPIMDCRAACWRGGDTPQPILPTSIAEQRIEIVEQAAAPLDAFDI